ncbi:MAG: fibronectin type III domain-containing protein [Bdellovibrio sp.]|nr:fibronectin type III domain-containing protein [Bdellovibrio sp.]
MFVVVTGCDLNPLGGSKSKLDKLFEPGKHISSAPPVLGAIADYIMDENDVQSIPFTISDPDTFMVCSLVFVKATSTNDTLIDSSGMVVGGTYPNCTLTLSPKQFQYGLSDITVDLYDFWTHAIQNFKLTVVHILSPGSFLITDAEGQDRSVDLTWQNAPYMIGAGGFTSGVYTVYYRVAGTTTYTSISHVTSPYTVTGLTNGIEYDFYVNARNSIGTRNSQVVQAQPTRFKFRGAEFISASTQYENTPGLATTIKTVNATMVANAIQVDANYPTISYSAPENPINGNFPAGTPPPSAVTTPSGKYKVYMNSQGNILSGAGQ